MPLFMSYEFENHSDEIFSISESAFASTLSLAKGTDVFLAFFSSFFDNFRASRPAFNFSCSTIHGSTHGLAVAAQAKARAIAGGTVGICSPT